MDQLSNRGSVEDIRCSLRHIEPKTAGQARKDQVWLYGCIDYEKGHKNRSEVIRLMEKKAFQLKRLIDTLQ